MSAGHGSATGTSTALTGVQLVSMAHTAIIIINANIIPQNHNKNLSSSFILNLETVTPIKNGIIIKNNILAVHIYPPTRVKYMPKTDINKPTVWATLKNVKALPLHNSFARNSVRLFKIKAMLNSIITVVFIGKAPLYAHPNTNRPYQTPPLFPPRIRRISV